MSSDLINPYLQARHLLEKSQQEVADEALVSVSCVRYNEQGLFLHPIPKLTEYFGRFFEKSALIKNYYRFQKRTRQINQRMWLLPEPNIFVDPIVAALKYNNINKTRFCKNFCCQLVLLYQPKRILNTDLGSILKQAGFTPVQLQELHDRLQEYHDRRNVKSGRSESRNASGTEVFRDRADSDASASERLVGISVEQSPSDLGQEGRKEYVETAGN